MMRCDRFEREGALALERSESLEAHFTECRDCREALEARRKIIGSIEAMSKAAPRDGWEAGVWARIDRAEDGGTWSKRRIVASLAFAASIAAAILSARSISWPQRGQPGLEIILHERPASLLRSADPQVGESWLFRATGAASARADLRIYFNSREMLMRCAEDRPCKVSGDDLELVLRLEAAGSYRAVLFSGSQLPVAVTGMFETDVARGLKDGAEVLIGTPMEAR